LPKISFFETPSKIEGKIKPEKQSKDHLSTHLNESLIFLCGPLHPFFGFFFQVKMGIASFAKKKFSVLESLG